MGSRRAFFRVMVASLAPVLVVVSADAWLGSSTIKNAIGELVNHALLWFLSSLGQTK